MIEVQSGKQVLTLQQKYEGENKQTLKTSKSMKKIAGAPPGMAPNGVPLNGFGSRAL
jgi:hypothetical protein